MAAVLAEMAAGGGKKGLKKAAQEGASPPRGARCVCVYVCVDVDACESRRCLC